MSTFYPTYNADADRQRRGADRQAEQDGEEEHLQHLALGEGADDDAIDGGGGGGGGTG